MRSATWTVLATLWAVLSVTAVEARERVYYYHNDHLGTPQAMSNAAGVKVWEAEYEPFGKAKVNEDPDRDGRSVINNLRFPGQYYDAETGLHYNYHRDYQPETGRYLQPDPIGLLGGLNPYRYVRNKPLNFVDPSGLYESLPHYIVPRDEAVRAGMPMGMAEIVGRASESVDTVYNPMSLKNRAYHFSDYAEAQARVDTASTLEQLGIALHTLMDVYTHEGRNPAINGIIHVWQSRLLDAWDPNSERDRGMAADIGLTIRNWMRTHQECN